MPKTQVRSKQIKDSDLLLEDMDSSIPCSKKANYAASVAPDANDDDTAGYAVGSDWFDITADKHYLCLDSTTATAVWKETTVTVAPGAGLNALTFMS